MSYARNRRPDTLHRIVASALTVFVISSAALVGPAEAQRRLAGPIEAEVVRIIDGDTIEVSAAIWLHQRILVGVRIAGIDAPELRGRCDAEKDLANAASELVAELAAPDSTVRLHQIRYDKFARRVVADVETEAGLEVAAALLAADLARLYEGRGKRPDWCES